MYLSLCKRQRCRACRLWRLIHRRGFYRLIGRECLRWRRGAGRVAFIGCWERMLASIPLHRPGMLAFQFGQAFLLYLRGTKGVIGAHFIFLTGLIFRLALFWCQLRSSFLLALGSGFFFRRHTAQKRRKINRLFRQGLLHYSIHSTPYRVCGVEWSSGIRLPLTPNYSIGVFWSDLE